MASDAALLSFEVSMIALGGPTLKLRNSGGCRITGEVSMIALGGPTLKPVTPEFMRLHNPVSMIALGGPTLKLSVSHSTIQRDSVSMIALGGPTLKLADIAEVSLGQACLNDSTGRAYTETSSPCILELFVLWSQ